MVDTRYVKKFLEDIFDFTISTNSAWLTKTFVNNHKGNVPVYGASQNPNEPSYGYMQDGLSDVKYFDDCLTYNRDGASGMVFYREGHFSLSEKVLPLVVKTEYKNSLDVMYLKYAIEREARKQDYTFSKKATKIIFKKLVIEIPVDKQGNFDIEKQRALFKKYEDVEERRISLLNKVKEISEISVILPKDEHFLWKDVRPIDLFNPKGGNMLYSKEWATSNQGEYYLYSGTTMGAYAKVNIADYQGEYLSWCIDGLAGYMMYHNEEFSVTCHRGVLEPKDGVDFSNIDLKYIKCVLEPIFRKRKKGREGDLGKNEYTSLKPMAIKNIKDTIPIPLKDDGTFDLEKQRELAKKYEKIEIIKNDLIERINGLTRIIVSG